MQRTASKIIRKLNNAGFEAYWAGGAVRDMLMGKTPKDIDIATSAKPEKIEALLAKTVPIGKKFGVILVLEGGHEFEVATFRSDAGYSDGRRPDYVIYANAKKDALRRDFTINGMFYDPIKKQVKDYVGGKKDIEQKIIRFIGDANTRIKEDNLRILRAIRFKNVLGFEYEPETWQAICKNAKLIKNVSGERVRDELNKMLDGKHRNSALKDLVDSKILKYILPELWACQGVEQPKNEHAEGDVFVHSLNAVKVLAHNAPLFVVWAVLLHDIGKKDTFELAKDRIRFSGHVHRSAELAGDILRRLKFSRIEQEIIVWLIESHMMMLDFFKMREAKRKKWLLDPRMKWLLMVHKADALGSKPGTLEIYYKLKELIKKDKSDIKKIPKPILSGIDLISNFGLKPGKRIGVILDKIHDLQIEGKINNKDEALKIARKLLKR